MRTVDHVQEEIGVRDLLQRRAERLDDLVRQVADETDGVSEGEGPTVGERGPSHRRVQRGEQRILDEYARARQAVEQRGLAGVGVAGDRDRGNPAALARRPFRRPDRLHVGELAAEPGHARAQPSPVSFDLRFARAPGPDPTAGPRHRLTPATQPRQHVLQLGKLDLRLAFPGCRVLGENVQDQRGPVDDLDLDDVLQLAQLAGSQFTVADNGVGADGGNDLAQFPCLAGTDVRGRVGGVASLDECVQDDRAGRVRKGRELGHGGRDVRCGPGGPHADEDDPFQPELPVLDLGDVIQFGCQTRYPAQGRPVGEIVSLTGGVEEVVADVVADGVLNGGKRHIALL